MTFRGFLIRLVYLAITTWVVGALIESFWTAFIWALTPLWFYEVLRPRPPRNPQPDPPRSPGPPAGPPTQRLP